MERIFFDTDVILDFLLNRQPFSQESAQLLSLSELGKLKVCVSGLTIANCYYILRRFSTHSNVIKKLSELSEIIEIMDMKSQSVLSAIKSNFKDFEDSLQNETAKQDSRIKVLLTRNIKDYKDSELSVMTPDMYLKLYKINA